MKVSVLECGRVILPASALFKNEKEFYPLCMLTPFNPKSKLINVPVFAFLIEHPNGKKIVFDTAWSSQVRKHPWKNMVRSLNWVKKFYDTADNLIDVISDHETELSKYYYEF